ncbi:hypothetical protein ASE17_08790 [Phenylobacterium sp. Root77]|jgi:uncharacterized protein (DUF2147 family)|uniref:DUF2147 domain-containing protein n=1 Tax=unclassified Phenylobacterium TaxID=2640670 RepID=UPI0006FEF596|nr:MULTISPECIES: DUF2147 domain-containing protein [unclassified Phenylobacterium]KQW73039.1 hypothetical protein ASC73_01360 [Phenylobacterium sp. Root1277]KQW92259.1 hypothetical protein ASC79_12070 [Phenylobacterium sp. Root1290]KRC40490.1 hypothetical protein ASE17_08790 [Phenylobacterium sp. Root77]
MTLARLAAATALAAAIASPALAADPVEGLWLVEAGSAKIKVAPCASDKTKMCGQVAWLKMAGAKDANNPDASLRSRPILGMLMIRDFKSAGPGKWTGGKIYDPNSGKTYGSKMSANPNGTLKVEGCVAVVCQAQTWKRAS